MINVDSLSIEKRIARGGVGGGILDCEDAYGVIESYPNGSVTEDVGFASRCLIGEIIDDEHLSDCSSQADLGNDDELPPHGLVDSSWEEEVDKKRLAPINAYLTNDGMS